VHRPPALSGRRPPPAFRVGPPPGGPPRSTIGGPVQRRFPPMGAPPAGRLRNSKQPAYGWICSAASAAGSSERRPHTCDRHETRQHAPFFANFCSLIKTTAPGAIFWPLLGGQATVGPCETTGVTAIEVQLAERRPSFFATRGRSSVDKRLRQHPHRRTTGIDERHVCQRRATSAINGRRELKDGDRGPPSAVSTRSSRFIRPCFERKTIKGFVALCFFGLLFYGSVNGQRLRLFSQKPHIVTHRSPRRAFAGGNSAAHDCRPSLAQFNSILSEWPCFPWRGKSSGALRHRMDLHQANQMERKPKDYLDRPFAFSRNGENAQLLVNPFNRRRASSRRCSTSRQPRGGLRSLKRIRGVGNTGVALSAIDRVGPAMGLTGTTKGRAPIVRQFIEQIGAPNDLGWTFRESSDDRQVPFQNSKWKDLRAGAKRYLIKPTLKRRAGASVPPPSHGFLQASLSILIKGP